MEQYEQAQEAAKSAKRWALISAVSWVALVIIYLLIFGIWVGMATATSQLLDL